MSKLSSIPPVGLMVIVVILSLFVLAVLLLFITCARYSRLASMVGSSGLKRDNRPTSETARTSTPPPSSQTASASSWGEVCCASGS